MRALRLHVRLVPCITVSARSCAHGKWSLRLADCLSQGDFWPAETHRDPSGDKPQHELAGMTIIIRQVISKLDAVSSVLCHDRISRGGAPAGKRFRYIVSQCPLVKSRNIPELQHVAMTRRVGESGLSRCSSRYSCPVTHCTRSFRYRT